MTNTKCIEIIKDSLTDIGFSVGYTGLSSIDFNGHDADSSGEDWFIEGSMEAFNEDNGDLSISYSISFSDDLDPFIGTVKIDPTEDEVRRAVLSLIEPDFVTI